MNPIIFFIVEKNELNGQQMVYSKCEQISSCYHFATLKEAEIAKDELNKEANEDFLKYNPTITFKK